MNVANKLIFASEYGIDCENFMGRLLLEFVGEENLLFRKNDASLVPIPIGGQTLALRPLA